MGKRIQLEIGDTLYGYCHGIFGRDSYNPKLIVGKGRDWVVVREKMSWGGKRHTVYHVAHGDDLGLFEESDLNSEDEDYDD